MKAGPLIMIVLAGIPGVVHAQREYRIEAGAAGSYTSYDNSTELGGSIGGTGRLGYWLWRRLSIEVEGSVASPKSGNGQAVTVTTLTGSALVNLPLGLYSSAFLRGGFGSVGYGTCPDNVAPATICGSTSVIQYGAGLRLALSPTMMLRLDALLNNSSSPSFANLTIGTGVSVMVGSRRLTDSDRDGVYDRYDRCPDTPAGALVDSRGCPTDNDRDGVFDGIDRCPQSPAGAEVDAVGCPQDADRDNVLDGIDRCPDTPPGAAVDRFGCPSDGDGDGVLDGLDRCPNTLQGATVDPLGCPGDQDNDGVFDGIDRCADTPPGTVVNTFGCPPTLDSDGDRVPDAADLCPNTPPGSRVDLSGCPTGPAPDTTPTGPPAPPAGADTAAASGWVVSGTAFILGSSELRDQVLPQLDSIAEVLRARPNLQVLIAGHAHDRLPPEGNLKLSTDRAQAIRLYLLSKGVRGNQLRIQGFGATRMIVRDTTAAARVQNRRTEITPVREP